MTYRLYSHIVVCPAEDSLIPDVAACQGAEVDLAGTAPEAVGVPVAVVSHVKDIAVLDGLLAAHARVGTLYGHG